MLKPENPRIFQLYLPNETAAQQLTIPSNKLKDYLLDLDPNVQVALLHLPTASGPYFLSIRSVPDELLDAYTFVVSASMLFKKIALINEPT
jgi:hypothetical protein